MVIRNKYQCRGAAGGVSFIFLSQMCLMNHPFRLGSQQFLSYSIRVSLNVGSNTSTFLKAFWGTIYFYTASATPGNLSYDFARGRHCTVSAAASRRHVDASLDLFARKSPRSLRVLAEIRVQRRELSARAAFFFVDGGSIN